MTPSGLVISGGGALTVGCLDQAKYVLGVPARMGKTDGFTGLVDEIDSPIFAAAAGLILSGIRAPEGREGSMQVIGKGLPIKAMTQKVTDLIKSFLP